MKGKKKLLIYMCLLLLIIAVLYTVLIKFVDVKAIAANDTNVGFASINTTFKNMIGYNETWYKISKYMGLIPIGIAFCYALLGLYQLIKYKKLSKVDKRLFALAGFYVVFILVYVLFEKLAINYRPFMIDGEVEASYPSTHTLLALCLCGSSLIVSEYFINNKKWLKWINIATWIVLVMIIVGRILSGVHWITDILGGIIISFFLLMVLYTAIYYLNNSKKDKD